MKLTPIEADPFKVTKASVGYSKGIPKSHCGICEFYKHGICTKVQGSIDPAYWCRLFKKQHRAEGGPIYRDEGGMTLQRTAPFPDAPEGYEFYAPSDEKPIKEGTPTGVASDDFIPGVGAEGVPSYEPPGVQREPSFIDRLSTPSKYQMEPSLFETQEGHQPVQEGVAAGVASGEIQMLDSGQWLDTRTGQIIPEEQLTRRAGVSPVTFDPSGKPEWNVPKMADILGNVVGGNVPGPAGPVLGSGIARVGGPYRPPELWHGISQVKLKKPISEMQADITQTPLSESKVTPADLQGGWLMPAFGDRSAAAGQLTGIGGTDLVKPVDLQGGHGYMPANTDRGVVWASGPSVISGIENKAAKLAASGDPVYFPYTAMGERSVDFSHHVSDALTGMLPTAKISLKDKSAFNEAMKTAGKDFGAVEDWPGIGSRNLREFLAKAPGAVRNKFAKTMDTAKFQNAGFPSVAEARHAVTDPRLLNAETGDAGLSISRIAAGAPRGEAAHRTYETALPGQYVGGFGTSVPKEAMYPDITNAMEAYRDKFTGFKPTVDYLMSRTPKGLPIAQKADQQWVDSMSGLLRSRGLLGRSGLHLGLYSAVERAIDGIGTTKASPQQWLATLKNTPGVKGEEMKWLGLEDWLKEQKGPVTKQQIADYVRDNQVQVQEVMKAEQSQKAPATRVNEIDQELHDIQNEFDRLHETPSLTGEDSAELKSRRAELVQRKAALSVERSRVVRDWQDQATGRTKFSQYTLPGGENYRELLLTLPPNNKLEGWKVRPNPHVDGEFEVVDPSGRVRYGTTDAADAQKYIQDEANIVGKKTDFKSSHFDEPNILAHIRFNDRTIDGKKTLFVEEVQSDWHQKGKREGYTDQKVKRLSEAELDEYDVLANATDRSWQESQRFQELQDRADAEDASKRGVPDAPFKTTWPELAMKRIIRYAAENGYDKVAWTPGDVQAARYDLSKHLDSIGYTKRGNLYNISAWGKDNTRVWQDQSATLQQVEDHLGKEMAEKISKGHGRQTKDGFTYLEDLDLKVGGEGMKGFYDQILPAAVNKLVKKHGVKVGTGNIETHQGFAKKYQLMNSTDHSHIRDFDSENEALYWAREHGYSGSSWVREGKAIPAHTQQVHQIDITPSLRKSAMEQGFPQFADGGGVKKQRLVPVSHNPFEVNHAIRRAIHGD